MNFFLALCFVACSACAGTYDGVINPLMEVTEQNFKARVLVSYHAFRDIVEKSNYYTPHETIYKNESESGYVHPVLEYYAFLTSYSADQKIAGILNELITTGGPFGFDRTKKANEAEQFIYDVAFRSVAKTQGKKVATSDSLQEKTAFDAITAKHPGAAFALSLVQSRWDAMIDLVQSGHFFNRDGLTLLPLNGGEMQKRLFFTNDLFLLGFSLGLSKRLRNSDVGKPTFLWEEWGMEQKIEVGQPKSDMEKFHSYVQWWFPSVKQGVDGLLSPRMSATLLRSLEGSKCKPLLQQMNRITWARMATFWGQKITATGLVESDAAWHQNWLTYSHNNLRMTRILIWLGAFGLEAERDMMLTYLESTAQTNASLSLSLSIWQTEPLFYYRQFNSLSRNR